MGKSSESRKSAIETRLIVPRVGRTLRRHPRTVKASNLPRREFLRFAAGAATLPAVSRDASAQSYPLRPITMIVPSAAGGPADMLARILAYQMRRPLGQSVIIENVSGADGSIGTGRVARARPDGYTLELGFFGTHVLNAALYSLQYDVLNDFAPIAPLSAISNGFFARQTLPANDLNEVINWLKANPEKASLGAVTASHRLIASFFKKETGTRFAIVPYRGVAPAVQDLLAGQIDLLFGSPDQLPLMRAGGIKAYAVTSDTRWALAPDIPTFAEMGLPALLLTAWYALFAPKSTPRSIIDRLNAAAVEALADPAVRSRLAQVGMTMFPRERQTAQALAAMQKTDAEKWWPIIKEFGIRAE
jgi:tripartite-type tricarboxylate transporter receptor subunit TctC